jgi:MFS family permease
MDRNFMNELEKSSRRITITLLVGQSLFSASFIMAFTVGSIIAVELANNNSGWSGVPSTLVVAGAALMAYPMGRFMDRFGRRLGLSLGYLLGIGGASLAALGIIASSLWVFLSGFLLLGLTRGVIDQGRYAAAQASPPSKRAQAISWVVLGGTAGSILGPGLISLTSSLAERLGLPPLSGPWLACGLFFALAILINNLFLRPDPQEIGRQWAALEPGGAAPSKDKGRPYAEIFQDPRTKLATGALIFGQLAMVTVMTMTPLHMHHHHHPLTTISWVIMAHTMGMFGLSFVTGWLVARLGQVPIILAGGIILILACLTAPLSSEVVWLGISLFLLGLGWNFCFVSGSALLSDVLRNEERGRVQGLTDTMINIVSGMGSIGGGLIFAASGYPAIAWLGVLVSLVPILLVLFLRVFRQQAPIKGAVSG